jgi:sigma-B regulation protein RsbU (phosphoserine phosphatase)
VVKQNSNNTNSKTAAQKRKITNLKLNSLLEITKAINSNSSIADLYRIYENVLITDLRIGKLALFINDEGWRCALKHGIKSEYEQIKVETDLLNYKEITETNVISSSNIGAFDVVIPVYHKSHPLAYLLIGDLDENKLEISATIKHLPFIQTLTNIIVVAIENKKLAKEYLRQEGVKKELELASEMQSMLFPSKLPNDEKMDVDALYQPHHQVGGDYYDFIRLNENEVAFCIADVSGKGVSAALLMANFQANLRALFKTTSSLNEIVTDLNRLVNENAKGEKFITLFIAKYNYVTRVLTYINAGHNPPVLVYKNTSLFLTTGCIGLGMLDDIPKMREGIITVNPSTVLVCYTDGLTEQDNDANEEFGMESLKNIVLKKSLGGMNELNNHTIFVLNKFKQGKNYIDDIALLSCKFL